MASVRESLNFVNKMLCMFGCPIFPSRYKIVNIITQIHGLAFLIVVLNNMFLDRAIGIRAHHPLVIRIITDIWNIMYLFGFLLLIVLIRFRRNKIMFVLEFFDQVLSFEDHKEIKRYSLVHVMLTPAYIISFRAFTCFMYSKSQGFNSLVLLIYTALLCWVLISINLYLCILKVVHLSERNILERIILKMSKIQEPKKVYKLLEKVIEIKKEISNQISILPFSCFMYLFVKTVASVCRYQIVSSDENVSSEIKIFSLLSLLRTLIDYGLLFFMTFQTESFCREASWKLESMKRLIIERKHPNEWSFVIEKIVESQKFEFNAFGFFNINRKTLLSFTASFVPLTVLFVQLIINQTKANN